MKITYCLASVALVSMLGACSGVQIWGTERNVY